MNGTRVKSRRRRAPGPPVEVELHLGDWGPKGAVLAEQEGRTVPIDRGIPGERVLALVHRHRHRRGVVTEVLEESPARIAAPCVHYAQGCGGCQWQHVAYGAQLAARNEVLNRELSDHGVHRRVGTIHGMAEPWRYRRTASIAIGWEAGFRPRGGRGIVEVRDCPIAHPLIGRLARRLNELLRAGQLPNYHGKVWIECTVVGSDQASSLQLLIAGIEGLTCESHPELPAVGATLAGIDNVSSVAYRHRTGEPRELIGPLESTFDVAGRSMWLPAGSFSQTNVAMLEVLLEEMQSLVRASGACRAADIYGGIGTFALQLARSVERMTLVELDPRAVAAAERTARLWGLTNVSFVRAHADHALPGMRDVDLVIVDPPRSGLGTSVTDALVRSTARLVLYVSCAPPTLAADLAALVRGGFDVRSVDAYDFYPQTYHVEALAVLER